MCEKLITMTDKTSDKMQISVDQYLQRSGRKIQHIRGDGNCMFRAFSFAFLHHEDHHFHLRSHIVRTMNLNEELFSEFLMPINKATISEQVKHMIGQVCGVHIWNSKLLQHYSRYQSTAALKIHSNMILNIVGA